MKLTRGKRIAFELLGPPALGTLFISFAFVCMSVREVIAQGKDLWRTCEEVGSLTFMVLLFAYLFGGVQSIIYTVIMEWRFSRGLDPRSWRSIWLSTVLGIASGSAVILVMGRDTTWRAEPMFFWSGFGLVVGFLMGLLVRHWSAGKTLRGETPL